MPLLHMNKLGQTLALDPQSLRSLQTTGDTTQAVPLCGRDRGFMTDIYTLRTLHHLVNYQQNQLGGRGLDVLCSALQRKGRLHIKALAFSLFSVLQT